MARKKDEIGGFAVILAILALIVWLIVVAAALAGPAVILGWWLVCEAKWQRWSDLGSVNECLPSAAAAAEISTLRDQVAEYRRMIALVEQAGEEEQLPTRMDGTFDNRNRRGRELNQHVEQISEAMRAALIEKQQKGTDASIAIARWAQCRTRLLTARAGAVVWLATFMLAAALRADIARDLGQALLKESPYAGLLGASAIGAGAALVGMLVVYFVVKNESFGHAAGALARSGVIDA